MKQDNYPNTKTTSFNRWMLFSSIMMMSLFVSSAFAQVDVTATGGTLSASYTTLKGAFDAINLGTHTGTLSIGISANTTETAIASLNASGSGAASYTTLSIQPTGGAARTITGSLASSLVDLNGADNVTIDGLNSGGNSLTISNTSTAATSGTSTLRFLGGATGNTVTKCSVLGSATMSLATNGGVIYFATDANTVNGNDNNTISFCNVGPAGANLPSKLIYGNGSATTSAIANSNITITNCNLYDYFLAGGCAAVYVLTGNTDWNVTNNKIYQTASRAMTSTMSGIYFSNTTYGNNIQFTGNTIGYASNSGTGTLTLTGTGSFQGIYLNAQTTAALACNLNSNTVSDISMTSTSGTFYGVYNASGASSNTININANTVKNIALLTTTGSCYGINWTSATNISVSNNFVYSITRNGAGSLYGIYSGSSSVNETVSGNTVHDLTSTAASISSLYGIYQGTASGTKVFQNNTIYNLTGAVVSTMYGLYVGYGTTVDISGNTVYGLTSTGGTAGAMYGIARGSSATTVNIYKNKVYDLSSTSTNPSVYGVNILGGTTTNTYNNLIGNISTTAANAANPMAGIYISGGTTSNVYFNTVSISGTSSGALFGSSALYASSTTTVDLRNNILLNNCTPVGATGFASAFRRSGLYNSTYYPTSSNKNLYYAGTPGTNNLIFYDGTNSMQTLAAYQALATGRDAASVTENPTFTSTSGASADFLHINPAVSTLAESGGSPVVGITDDYDGNTRHVSLPDIGADEFAGTNPNACSGTPTAGTISGAAAICANTATTLTLSGASSAIGISYKWSSSATTGGPYTDISPSNALTLNTGALATATYYIVTVTCAYGGGTASATEFAVGITAAPPVAISPSSGTICSPGGSAVTLTASGADTYVWSPAGGLSGTTTAAVDATPTLNTTYTVVGTATGTGCTASSTVDISITGVPSVTATATPSAICTGANSQLLASGHPTTIAANYLFSYGFGGSLDAMTGATTVLGSGNDDTPNPSALNIGFSFVFSGTAYTQYSVSPDGWLSLGGAVASAEYSNSVTSTTNTPKIYPLWDDLATGLDGNVKTVVIGTAPNRIFIAQWFVPLPRNTTGNANSTFQAWLYEGSNNIEFRYGTMGASVASASAGITGTAGTFRSLTFSSNSASNTVANNAITTLPASGTIYTFSPGDITYSWSPADFLDFTDIANPLATAVTSATTYTVTPTSNGCVGTASTTAISIATAVSVAVNNATICSGTGALLTAVPTGGGVPITYTWEPAGGLSATTGVSVTASPTSSITYTVTATDACGTTDTAQAIITVNPTPSASISPVGPLVECSNNLTQLVSTTNGTSPSYQWTLNGGNIGAGGTSANYTPAASGSYSVVITDGPCSATATAVVVTVNLAPTALSVSPASSVICAGGSQALVASGASYSGIVSNSIVISLSNPATDETTTCPGANTIASFTLPPIPGGAVGAHLTINGITLGTGSWGSEVRLNFSGTGITGTSPCFKGATSTSSPNPFNWATELGGTLADTATLAALLNTAGGTVVIKYNESANDISTGPDATFPATATLQYFYNLSGQHPVTWTPAASGLNTYAGLNVVASPSSSTTYTATATATNGCTSSSTAAVGVNTLAISGTPANASCYGVSDGSIEALASGGTSAYEYSLDGSIWQSGTTFSGLAAGTYTLYVKDAQPCTTSVAGIVVGSPAQLIVSASNDGPVCAGSNVTLTATSGFVSYSWSGPLAYSDNVNPSTIVGATVAASGTYTVTVSDGSCTEIATTDVTVDPIGTISVSLAASANPSCVGGSVTFTATPVNASSPTYDFYLNAGLVQSTASATYSYVPTTGDQLYVIMTAAASGCATGSPATSNTITQVVNGNPANPTITAGGVTTFCANISNVTLTSSYVGGNTWSTAATTDAITTNVSGSYTVTYTDGNGCTAISAPTLVTANTSSVAVVSSNPGGLCTGANVTLTATATPAATSYLWSPSTETTQAIVASASGTYDVQTTDANGCTATNSIVIADVALPTASISGNTSICTGIPETLTATATAGSGTITTYQWVRNGSTNVGTNSSTFGASVAGSYTVVVTNSNGCSVTSAAHVLSGSGPLSGIKTIDKTLPASCSNYISFADAFYDLSTYGVSGNVTFNVAAGQTDTANLTLNACALGVNAPSASQTVTFIKSGAGANPLITAGTGVGASDAIVKIVGADYITFDAIDLQANANNLTAVTRTEVGYALLKCSGTDGAQHNTIQNCVVTLNKSNTNATSGIYSANADASFAAVTVTATSGANSYNKFYSNTITNSYNGIVVDGFSDATPYALYDQNNEIGAAGLGNNISNLGGSTMFLVGISTSWQNNLNVVANTVNTGANAGTGGMQGISIGSARWANTNVTGNTVTLQTSPLTTVQCIGILNNSGSRVGRPLSSTVTNVVNIQNNIIQNSTYTGSDVLWLMYMGRASGDSLSAYNLNITGNQLLNNTSSSTSSTGTMFGIISQLVSDSMSISNNIITGNIMNGNAAHQMRSIVAGPYGLAAGSVLYSPKINVSGNTIENNSSTATSALVEGIAVELYTGAALQLGTSVYINNNKVGNVTNAVATSGAYTGIRHTTYANTVLTMSGNKVYNITRSAATSGTFTGIAANVSSSPYSITMQNDTVSGINMSGATSAYFYGISSTSSPTGAASSISNNIVSGNTLAGTGYFYGINQSSSPSSLTMSGNTVTGNSKTGIGGYMYLMYNYSPVLCTMSGNVITNNTMTGGAAYPYMYCAYVYTSKYNFSGNTISNNGISASSGTSYYASVYGFYDGGSSLEETITNNAVNNLYVGGTSTGSSTIRGMYHSTSSSAGQFRTYSGNVINKLYATGVSASIAGIYSGTGLNVTISKNKIFGLYSAQNTGTANLKGIMIGGGTTVNVSNNMINVRADSLADPIMGAVLTANNSVVGMEVSGGTTVNLRYNTIRLAGSGTGTSFGSSGISITSTTPTVSLNNNIVLNLTGAGGLAAANCAAGLRRTVAAMTGYASTSNRNIWYAGTASASHVLYYDAVTGYQTLAAFQGVAGLAPREASSRVENVVLLSTVGANAYFLHVDSTAATFAESGAANIAGITDDIDTQTRQGNPGYAGTGSAPDIGADEFQGISLVPVIANVVVAPIGTCVASAHTISADVTTAIGVIDSVKLSYSFNGVPQTPIKLTVPTSGSTYTFTVPAATPPNAVVTWSLNGTNNAPLTTTYTGTSYQDEYLSGQTITASALPTTVCAGDNVALSVSTVNTYYTEPFESASFPLTSFVVSGTSATADQSLTYFSEGSSSLRFNTTATSATALLTGNTNINLAGLTSATLSFSHQTLMEGPSSSYDYGYVEYSVDGGVNWIVFPAVNYVGSATLLGTGSQGFTTKSYPDWITNFTSGTSLPNNTLWKTESYTIPSAALVSTFRIRFRYTTDSSTNYYGWMIDNVKVSATVPFVNPVSYAWTSSPSGFTSTSASASVTPLVSTTYTASITDANGCSLTATASVTALPIPAAPTGVDSTQCGNGVPACYVTGGTPGATFNWYDAAVGGNLLQSGLDTTYTTSINATQVFYVSEVGANGCPGDRVMVTATVTAPDPIDATSTLLAVCPGTAFDLDVAWTPVANPSYVFTWVAQPSSGSGMGGTQTGAQQTGVTPTIPGTYNYVVTAVDATALCTIQDSVSVLVYNIPTITSVVADPDTVCATYPTVLTALTPGISAGFVTVGTQTTTSISGSPFRGGAGTTVGNKVQYLFTAAELSAAGLNAGNITSLAFNVTSASAYSIPNFTIRIGHTAVSSLTATFEAAPANVVYGPISYTSPAATGVLTIPITAFSWNGTSNVLIQICNDPINPSATSLNIAMDAAGTGKMSYQNDASSCASTAAITTTNRAVITFGGQTAGFSGGTYTWTWMPGSVSGNQITENPISSTNYMVTAYDPATTCSNSANLFVFVNPTPDAPTAVNGGHCGNQTPTCSVIGSGTPGSYFTWYFDATGGSPIAGQSGSSLTAYPRNQVDTFYVSETFPTGICESPRTMVIETNSTADAITATATVPNDTICPFGTVTLSATQGTTNTYTTYTWTTIPAGGAASGQSTTAPAPNIPGQVIWVVTASDGTCVTNAQDTIVVIVPPIINSISASVDSICPGSPVTLTVSVPTTLVVPVYNENFETFPLTGFALTNTGTGSVAVAQDLTHFTNGAGSALLSYAASSDGQLAMTSSIDLTGKTNPRLVFSHIASMEGVSGTTYDLGAVEYSLDGGANWLSFPVGAYLGTGTLRTASSYNSGAVGINFSAMSYPDWISAPLSASSPSNLLWKTETITLAAYTTSTNFRIRFRLTSDSSLQYYGWLIDGVSIEDVVPNPSITYAWTGSPSGTAGLPGTTNIASIIANPTATTTYMVQVGDDNPSGCYNLDSVIVFVHPEPLAPINPVTSEQCGSGVPVASVTRSGPATDTFKWYTVASGGTEIAGQTDSVFTVSLDTTTTFYVAEFNGNCEGPRTALLITVNPSDTVTITAVSGVCMPSTFFTLDAVQQGTGSNYDFVWSAIPSGTAGLSGTTGTSITATPTAVGTYTYTVTATDIAAGCATVVNHIVTVNNYPVITSVSASPSTVCAGSPVLLSAQSIAGTPGIAQIGTGTATTSSYPYYRLYGSSKTQMLYRASELAAAGLTAGNITSIGFDITAIGGAMPNASISLKNTASTTISAFESGMTQVASYASYTPAVGISSHTITPFLWNGTSNLIVEFCFQNNDGGAGSTTVRYSNPGFASTFKQYQDNAPAHCTTPAGTTSPSSTIRPNLYIGGTVGANLTNTLNWSWSNGGGAGSSVTVNPLVTTTYTVTASAGVCTDDSTVTVTVNPLPDTAVAHNSVQCGYGTPTSYVDGVAGPFRWYDVPTGGTPLSGQSDSVLIAYPISVTDTFYVSAYNGTCESIRAMVIAEVTPVDTLTATINTDTICLGSSATLTAIQTGSIGNAFTSTWTPLPETGSGITGTATGASVAITPTAAGSYVYTLTGVDGICNSAPSMVTLVVLALPPVNAGPDVSICAGSSVNLTATGVSVDGKAVNSITIALSNPSTDETTTCPGANQIASFTLPPIPGGAIGAHLIINGVNHVSGSYASEVRLNFSGSGIIGTSACFAGNTNSGTPNPFDYATYNADTATIAALLNPAGGIVNIKYNEGFNDNTSGPDATFPATATLQYYYNVAPATIAWTSDPAGITGSGANLNTGALTSTTSFIATATSGAGCVGVDTVVVTVASSPGIAAIALSADTICTTGSVTLTASGLSGGAAIQWQTSPSGLIDTWTDIPTANALTYATPTLTASTWYRLYATCGGVDTSGSVVVIVATPTISAANVERCGVGQVKLTAVATGTVSWYSTLSGGTPLFVGSPYEPILLATTSYYVESSIGTCVNPGGRVLVTATLTTAASVSFTTSATTVCDGTSITLTASSSPVTPGYVYYWSTDGVTIDFTGNPYILTPVATASYYLLAIDSTNLANICGAYAGPTTVVVNPNPEVTASTNGATDVCQGQTFNLTSSGTNTLVYNQTFTNTTPMSIPDNDPIGAYSPLVVSGVPTASMSLGDLASVTMDITHTWDSDLDIVLVAPDGTTFIYLASGVGSSGDNFTNTVFTPTAVTAIASGTAPFTGTFIPADPFSTFNGIDPNGTWNMFIADFATGDVGTLNSWSLNFNVSAPVTWSWTSTPAGFTSAAQSPGAVDPFPQGPGTVTYDVVATNQYGCTATSSVSVNSIAITPVVITPSGTTTFCGSGTVDLDAYDASYTEYLWSPGGETTSSITVSPTSTTTYTVTVGNGNCSATTTQEIIVHPDVAIGITPSSTVPLCGGAGSVTLTADTGYTFYLWSPGGETTDAITVSPVSTTLYTLFALDANGCTQMGTYTVVSNPAPATPIITPAGPETLCWDGFSGTSEVTLTADASGDWNDLFSTTGTSITVNAADYGMGPQTFTITVTNGFGCQATASVVVNIDPCASGVSVDLKLFLEGYIISSGPTMMYSTLYDLEQGGMLTGPYSADATDTIQVNLWTAASVTLGNPDPDYSEKVILHNTGLASVNFATAPAGNYYIAVKHKNSIETWSSIEVALASTAIFYDFSDLITRAFDDGVNPPMQNVGGTFAFYSGDVNQDGTVDGSDMNDVYNDNNLSLYDYLVTDCTGDGTADGTDMNYVYNNNNLSLFYARPY